MTWIPVTPHQRHFSKEPAIKLYPPESPYVSISLAAWELLGKPERLALYYNPERVAVAVQAHDEGYKVGAKATHGNSEVTVIQIGAGRALRAIVAQCRHAWPEKTTILPLVREGDMLIAELAEVTDSNDAGKEGHPMR